VPGTPVSRLPSRPGPRYPTGMRPEPKPHRATLEQRLAALEQAVRRLEKQGGPRAIVSKGDIAPRPPDEHTVEFVRQAVVWALEGHQDMARLQAAFPETDQRRRLRTREEYTARLLNDLWRWGFRLRLHGRRSGALSPRLQRGDRGVGPGC
jgi:hypothetical protein